MKPFHILVSLFFASTLLQTTSGVQAAAGSRVLYINSYHDGYAPSDQAMNAFIQGATAQAIEVEVFYLDTKRNSSPMALAERTLRFLDRFLQYNPDLVVAADDDAVRYIVAPYLKGTSTAVVFCGVNWSCSQYGLPTSNVTGMIEVLPIRSTIQTLQTLKPHLTRMLVLSEVSNSERSNRELLDPLFKQEGLEPQYRMVQTFTEWMDVFAQAQHDFDLIYLPTNGAIRNWDKAVAKEWVEQHIRIPVFTCDDFMMDYCVFGRTKIPTEQGEWALQAAVAILNGTKPNAIEVAENTGSRLWLNSSLADKIGLKIPDSVKAENTLMR